MISAITPSNTQAAGVSQIRISKVSSSNNAADVNSPQDPAAATTATSETIDFTNISPREMGKLITAGMLGNTFPPLPFIISPNDPNPEQTALAMQDNKINYVENAKNQMAMAKSRGDEVSAADSKKFLDIMTALQGKSFPETQAVNAYA